MVVPLLERVGERADRPEHVGVAVIEAKGGRQDTDDAARMPVENDRLADHARVGAEPSLEETVAEEDDRARAGVVVVRQKIPPQDRPHSERREEVVSDVPATEAFGAVHPGEVELRLLHGGQGLERSVLVAPVDIVRPGHRHAGEQLGLLVQKDEAVGVAVRQRAQEDGVDRAEDRRVRAETEGQRDNGD